MAFGITYEVVMSAGEQLQAQNVALNAVVEGMEETAARHFAEWNALSVETYASTHRSWNQSATVMQNDLDINIRRLAEIVANYQDGDRRAAAGG